MNRWQRRDAILHTCDAIIVMMLTMSLALLEIGVKDRVAIWEGFAFAFLFMYWKQRYKFYIVRREREKLGCYENSK